MPKPAIPAKGYRKLRATRISLPGHAYLVTTVTQGRQRLFADFATARVPDHLHLLLQLGEAANLSAVMNRIKSRIGRVVNRHLRRTGTVWQCGFHEHLLRREEDLKGIARYVVLNPVRAGLVGKAADYPHWDAIWV